MILEALINIFFAITSAMFGVLPDLPPMPSAIVDGGQWLIDTLVSVISVLRMIYGGVLLDVIIGAVAVILSFEWLFHSVMWVIKKIPKLDVK